MATLQTLTAMMPWDCIEYVANTDQGSCEAYLSLPRELKENSNTLETKLTAAGFTSIMLITFPPSDGNKTAAACVGRIRTKRDAHDASYCKLGSHDRTLENRILGKPSPAAAAGGGRGGAGPSLQSEQEFDEKTKAAMEATGKKCDVIIERMVTPSALDEKLASIARKEDMTGMATKLDEMSARLERSNETIAAHEATIRTLQTTIAANETTIAANEGAIQARDTTIAGHEVTIRTLQTTVTANEATIAVNEGAIAALEDKNSRHERKIAEQGNMLGKLRPVQTELAKTKEELKAMTNYRDTAVQGMQNTQTALGAVNDGLRRELSDARREAQQEKDKMDDDRNAWNNEREFLMEAAADNERFIFERFRAHVDTFQCRHKRPRTDDAAGDGGRAP